MAERIVTDANAQGKQMEVLRDKTGRKIMIGDILKVFHFVGRRRKRYYMYKQVVGTHSLGKNPRQYLKISHLDMTDTYYNELLDGRILEDYEIVQGIGKDHFEDRKGITRKDTIAQESEA